MQFTCKIWMPNTSLSKDKQDYVSGIPLVKKVISYFTRNLPKIQQSNVKLCLKLIAFGVSSILLTFEDKYYEYSEKGIKTKGLAIGGYESDFLADLVASYLFEKMQQSIQGSPMERDIQRRWIVSVQG